MSLVDVPGHEGLVRTMVSGATGIDLALLVVAADDSVKPQTREHLDILKLLAVRTGAPVVPVFCWPEKDGRYRIAYLPEVPVESTGDRAADAFRLTARCTEIIEQQIRNRPELWSWMHQRWKTRPLLPRPAEMAASPAFRYRRRAEG